MKITLVKSAIVIIWTLRVEDPSLILRKPLEIAGFPIETNVPVGGISPDRRIH
ncbi:MAG: hypothetical protein WBN75_15885 [Verrucomicrobiia bacterium]|jgi:hypothetical protein